MPAEDVKRRFAEAIELRIYDDKYIDKYEEREIALLLGIAVDSAGAVLAPVCDSHGYVLESRVLGEIKELIRNLAGKDGIGEKAFYDAVAHCKKLMQGKKNDAQCKRIVLEVIEENGVTAKTGLFRNWYALAKKEVGLA